LGCRVMVTGRASKTRREGSIPSWPAEPRETHDHEHLLHLLVLLWSRASCDGLRLWTQHHRVPRVHRPLLDVAPPARQQGAASPSRPRGPFDLVLRGRHQVARLRPCLRAGQLFLGRSFNSRTLLSHCRNRGATPRRSTELRPSAKLLPLSPGRHAPPPPSPTPSAWPPQPAGVNPAGPHPTRALRYASGCALSHTILVRGRSSNRRASRWHREGCWCDSSRLHRFECW
jgi:hypothetical protein